MEQGGIFGPRKSTREIIYSHITRFGEIFKQVHHTALVILLGPMLQMETITGETNFLLK